MLFGQHFDGDHCHEILTTSSWDNFKTVATKNYHVYVQNSKGRSHLKSTEMWKKLLAFRHCSPGGGRGGGDKSWIKLPFVLHKYRLFRRKKKKTGLEIGGGGGGGEGYLARIPWSWSTATLSGKATKATGEFFRLQSLNWHQNQHGDCTNTAHLVTCMHTRHLCPQPSLLSSTGHSK